MSSPDRPEPTFSASSLSSTLLAVLAGIMLLTFGFSVVSTTQPHASCFFSFSPMDVRISVRSVRPTLLRQAA